MSVCKSCGKKYSKWATPVSARGVCSDCFEAELARQRKPEPQVDVVPQPVEAASPLSNAINLIEKAVRQSPVPVDILIETLGVTFAFFGSRILLTWLGAWPKTSVTTAEIVATSLTNLGWILLVVCLLNRSGSFQWRFPESTKAWLVEFGWAALLFVTSVFAKGIMIQIGRELHLPSGHTMWFEGLRNRGTWVAFQLLTPLSAIYQELVCRVYMQSRLTQILRGHSILVVLISAWLFVSIHNYALLQSLGLFASALVYGASYQLNRKIPRLVIAHAANNMIAASF